MSDWLMRVIKAEAERLIELAADDDELRADLRALAESILAATASQSNADESTRPRRPPPSDAATEDQSTQRMNRSGSSHWDGPRAEERSPVGFAGDESGPRPSTTI